MSNHPGTLYIVATPLGNLEDISARALRILSQVDLIAAEDTRHSIRLLRHYGINTPLTAMHEYNERSKSSNLIQQLQQGKSIAVISDAGTPLISDPGYTLVRAAHEAGITVSPIPGACAAIAALSASGLPSNCFVFQGFIPTKKAARRTLFENHKAKTCTLIYYESPHRIAESLQDMVQIFGAHRQAAVARELTKQYETLRSASLAELSDWVQADPNQQKGELVVLVQGMMAVQDSVVDNDTQQLLELLLTELSLKQAVSLAVKLTGAKKSLLYNMALALRQAQDPP